MMKLMEIKQGTMNVLESWRLVLRRIHTRIILVSTLLIWVSAAWLCRLAEARFALLNCRLGDPTLHYDMIDMLWLIPVTMTSIGYGDITPQSYIDRFIAVFVGFYGMVISAFLVDALNSILQITRREKVICEWSEIRIQCNYSTKLPS